MALHVPPALRMRLRGTLPARLYARAHAVLYAWTGGRIGGAIHVARGARPPVLLLSTTGRRTGKTRTTPLLYLRDGADLVVAASNAGHPSPPDWWRNLAADPRAAVRIGNERVAVVAVEVEDPRRRAELWSRFVAMYDGLDDYQRQAARRIPLVALTPVSATR